MSKKHQKIQQPSQEYKSEGGEYAIIKHDLVKVVLLNALYLALVLSLYYSNRRSGFLERWFASWLNY